MSLLKTIILFFLFSSFQLADHLKDAKKGDFIVTEQNKNYSLLLIKENNSTTFLFEEITIPVHLTSSILDWNEWVKNNAKGHTSWIQYEIDPSTLELLECYSYSKKGWLYRDSSEHFLSKLLSLPLFKIEQEERKRIGPPPIGGEADRRPLWNPSLVQHGKKNKISCEAWKARWPKDDSLLSSCDITLYFPKPEISPFPLWIEASNGHFHYAIRVIAVGQNMTSSLPSSLPKRPPQFLKPIEKTKDSLRLPIKIPPYYKQANIRLFLLDLFPTQHKIGPLSFHLSQNNGLSFLEIPRKELPALLQKNHHYKWLLVIEGSPLVELESEEIFPGSFFQL